MPYGMAVTVLENADKQFHLVMPPVPIDELSGEALDAVAVRATVPHIPFR